MYIDDEEIIQLARDGAKLRQQPVKPKQPAEASEIRQLIEAIKNVGEAVVSASKRPAPGVTVAPAKVSVEPQIHVPAAPAPVRKWKVSVVERDNSAEQRIKTLTFEAIDDPIKTK